MGKGGRGKRKKSSEWYEHRLMGRLPKDDLINEPETGMSKQKIYDFFGGAEEERNVGKNTIDPILERGIKNKRIRHRPPYKTETARMGYFYKTPKGVKWYEIIKESKLNLKKLDEK